MPTITWPQLRTTPAGAGPVPPYDASREGPSMDRTLDKSVKP